MKEAWSLGGVFIAGLILGGVAISQLPSRLNEPSIYKVVAEERCIPDKGLAFLLNYNGRGVAHVTVVPPEPVAKAPEKEKKQ